MIFFRNIGQNKTENNRYRLTSFLHQLFCSKLNQCWIKSLIALRTRFLKCSDIVSLKIFLQLIELPDLLFLMIVDNWMLGSWALSEDFVQDSTSIVPRILSKSCQGLYFSLPQDFKKVTFWTRLEFVSKSMESCWRFWTSWKSCPRFTEKLFIISMILPRISLSFG